MSCIIIQLVNQTQKTQKPIQQFQETNTQPPPQKEKKQEKKQKESPKHSTTKLKSLQLAS